MKCRRIFMKKLGILVIALALLVVGMAMAEPGAIAVLETQGLAVSTTVIGAGNFNAASSVELKIINSDGDDLTDTLPLEHFTLYSTVYTEDTQNSEMGYISYDKDLDVSTANKLNGQYNVQAVKQITYLGIDASSVVSNDYMMLDGAGERYGKFDQALMCPFSTDNEMPSFCNIVETGSSVNLKVANMNTQMGERFIMKTADPGVQIYNNVAVGAYDASLPSKGSVSAFIQGSIKEGGPDGDGPRRTSIDRTDLAETVSFKDVTSFSGDITSFGKSMAYTSKLG
jgi:hypothetical protein